MAGEVDKAVQQEQVAVPAPLPDRPVEESQDVEMTDAPTAVKTPEQVAAAVPEKPSSLAGISAPEPTSVSHPPVETPKEAAPEPISAPEAPKQEASKVKVPEPADATAVSTKACPVLDLPVQQSSVAPDGTDNKEESASEKPTENSAQPAEAPPAAEPPAEPPTAQPAKTVANKAEEAADAAVNMLASNLDTPVKDTPPSGTAEPEEPVAEAGPQSDKSPVTGDKRKANDGAEANGDASSKKVNLEATPLAPATNGSPPTRKAGRPKKERKQPAPVGKTARRTRSQGATDV